MQGVKNIFLGYKPDFNGLGILVFKHEGEWRIQTIVNEGLEGMNLEAAATVMSKYLSCFDFVERDNNHCVLPASFDGGRIDLKMELQKNTLYVSYSLNDDDRNPNFVSCITGRNYRNIHR